MQKFGIMHKQNVALCKNVIIYFYSHLSLQ